MSTKEPLELFLDQVRTQARDRVFSAAKKRLATKRKAERRLRKQDQAKPFSDLVMADVERLRASGEYEVLAEVPAFGERVRELEEELTAVMDEAQEAEDDAVALALENPPPEVELVVRHQKEQNMFKLQTGMDDEGQAAPSVREAYKDLLRRQQGEIRELESS